MDRLGRRHGAVGVGHRPRPVPRLAVVAVAGELAADPADRVRGRQAGRDGVDEHRVERPAPLRPAEHRDRAAEQPAVEDQPGAGEDRADEVVLRVVPVLDDRPQPGADDAADQRGEDHLVGPVGRAPDLLQALGGEQPGDDEAQPHHQPEALQGQRAEVDLRLHALEGTARLEVPHRVDRIAADPDLEVQVRAGRVARVAGVADDLALADALADRDRDPRLVAVARGDAAAVVDAGVVAVAAGPAGDRDGAAVGGAQRRALRDGDVDAGVEPAPAVAERRGERAVDRPDEAARALPDRRRRAGRSTPASRAAIFGLLLLERGEVGLELVAVRADGDERLVLVRRAPPAARPGG